jgi:hypothetical protein
VSVTLRICSTLAVVTALVATAAPALASAHYSRAEAEEPAFSTAPAPEVEIPEDAVRIELGDDAQAIVSRHPAGTTFVFAAGVHRGQRVVPRSGDTFVGESGAILAGSRVLDPAAFTRSGGVWRIGGQSQQTSESGRYGCTDWSTGNHHYAECGHEAEVFHGEELFADGQRLRRVNTAAEVDAPGEWHLDMATDVLTMADDPARAGVLEVTTTDYAFVGAGTDRVTIANLVVRHYGSRAQRGAIDGTGSTNWSVVGVDASSNHGAGLGIGPGMTVTHSRFTDNGNLGLEGRGDDPVSLPIHIAHNEIAHNAVLGFQHGWSAGGIKLTLTTGTLFEHNWVHHNAAKGVWFDIDNADAVIRSNLVEHNGTVGIFYEISRTGRIAYNTVRNNHTSGNMERSFGNIAVVASADVEVVGNVVAGGGSQEIIGYHQDRGPGLVNLRVHDNHVLMDSPWGGGQTGVKDLGSGDPYAPSWGNRFEGNTYHLTGATHPQPFFWAGRSTTPADWQRLTGETITTDPIPTSVPADRGFQQASYGYASVS